MTICQRGEGSRRYAYSGCRSTKPADGPTRLVGTGDSNASERLGSADWSPIARWLGGDRRASAQLGASTPALKINNEPVQRATLQSRLRQLLQNRSENVIHIQADATLPFAAVVDVIDVCHSTGVKVVVVAPIR